MAKKVYDEDGLDMQKTDWSGDESINKAKIDEYLLFSMAASQLITEILIPVNKKPRK